MWTWGDPTTAQRADLNRVEAPIRNDLGCRSSRVFNDISLDLRSRSCEFEKNRKEDGDKKRGEIATFSPTSQSSNGDPTTVSVPIAI